MQLIFFRLKLRCFRIGLRFILWVLILALSGFSLGARPRIILAKPSPELETIAIAQWPNGSYQLCSQPDPKDWKDGAGVCVVFSKLGYQIDGYYGYPHSDRFICIRGAIAENLFKGEGLAFTWFTTPTPKTSSLEKQWDTEGRMRVDQAQILKLEPMEEGWASWVRFRSATLDLKGLYRYAVPRMRPAGDLCNW